MKAALALSALALAASTPASAQSPYSTVYVFGDSLSDRGRIPGLIEAQSPGFPLVFPVSPPYFDARFSNGPTYAERLPDLLGIAPAPDQNLAVGGAETGDGNIADSLLPPSIELPGIAEQIDSFVSSGESIGSDALVVLYGGSNDYFGFLDDNADPTSGEISAFVGVTIGNIEDDIRSLAAAGATTVLVPNVPNLGATPSYLGTDQEAAATALAAEHAAALNSELGALADELGVEIVVTDFATGFDLLLADPALFGLTDVTTPCVTSATDLPAYVTPGTVCSEEEQATRLFWDSVHPTSIGHELLAEYAADTLTAPTTLAAQAELAALAGDDFLRRMDQALQGGVGGRSAMLPARRILPPGPTRSSSPARPPRANAISKAVRSASTIPSPRSPAASPFVRSRT